MKRLLGIVGTIIAAVIFLSLRPSPPDPFVSGRKISSWTENLRDPGADPILATQNLRQAGPLSAPHLAKLLGEPALEIPPRFVPYAQRVPLLRNHIRASESTRVLACEILAALGPDARSALPEILPLLGDHSQSIVQAAEHLLRQIGAASAATLCKSLSNAPEPIRARAAHILRDFPNAEQNAVALIGALEDKSPNVRAEAAATLGALNVASARVPLLEKLTDPSPRVRASACAAFGSLGDRSVTYQLTLRLEDTSTAVQLEAAKSLWNLNHDPTPILPILTRLLLGPESWQAAYALAEMREAAAPAVPALIRAIQREPVPRPFRSPPSATFALSRIGSPAVPALVEALADGRPIVRLNAAVALGSMDKAAVPAADALLHATQDRSPEVREAAALALGAIGCDDPMAIDALAQCLRAEDIFVRFTAVGCLRRLAPQTQWAASSE